MTRAEELAEQERFRADLLDQARRDYRTINGLRADAEALAEALKWLLHYAGGEIPAHHVAKAELALARYRGENEWGGNVDVENERLLRGEK